MYVRLTVELASLCLSFFFCLLSSSARSFASTVTSTRAVNQFILLAPEVPTGIVRQTVIHYIL